MSEFIKDITDYDLINYWQSFFDKKMTLNDINEMIETVSNKNLNTIIQQNKYIDTSIIDSLRWGQIENELCLKNILERIYIKNNWVYFYEPILKKYVDKLIHIIKNSNIVADVNSIIFKSIESIISQLNQIAYQTLIVEIHYAKKSNLLKGNTKEERGRYFSDVLLKNGNYQKEIFTNYPELTRILDLKANYTADFIIKIITDTEKEMINIEQNINNGKKIGKLTDMFMGEGDTHNKGKSVVRLIFDTKKTIIYKPHSLDIDRKYYEFIDYINKLSEDIGTYDNLLAGKVYTTEDAGWQEFIEYKECDTEEDIKNFYYRVGKLLCLLHSLNGNDMHHENIIAHKDIPVLIDLETLMHPVLSTNNAESAIEIAMKEIREAVTSTHLLPSKIINTKSDKILEIGGLGASKEQESPFKAKFIENYGTDEVKIIKRHGKILPKDNNPAYNNEVIDSKTYKNEIICGFKDMYKWILANKSIYVNKIESIFENCNVRVLYRATNVYAQLMFSSYHPDLLTNYADRYVYMHRLAMDYKEKNHKMISLEISELMNCDIPYFSINLNSKQINNSHLSNVDIGITKSTIDIIKTKINEMNDKKMYRQICAINTSFMTEDYTGHIKTPISFQDNIQTIANNQLLVATAIKIADYLLECSITGKKHGKVSRTWLSSQDIGLGFKLFDNSSGDIYSGLSGIALFYNYLWKVTNQEKYKVITEEVINSVLETMPKDFDYKYIDKVKSGAFNGLGGVAYVLFYVDYSNNSSVYSADILNILDILKHNIIHSKINDIINQVGNLGIMISIYEKIENQSIKDITLEICDTLVSRLIETKLEIENKPGISWSLDGLVGYAHGNSGIIAQLYRWYKISNDENILKLISDATLYERSMYSTEYNNWYKSINEQEFSCGWCHGAPGVLLSKIQLKKLGYEEQKIDDEILLCIKKIIRSGLNNDISLCHGDMGNMVILKEAAITLNDKILYNQAVATIEELITFIERLLQTEEFKENNYTGFMTGLSGIAYEILRIGREKEIPNVLGLE